MKLRSSYAYTLWSRTYGKNETNNYFEKILNNEDEVNDFLILRLSYWLGSGTTKRGDFNRDVYDFMKEVINPEVIYRILSIIDRNKTVDAFEVLDKGSLADVGNEDSSEFIERLQKQFIYIHENATDEENRAKQD